MQTLVNNLVGKHVKAALFKLEEQGLLTPAIRKVLLDSFNDFKRDLFKNLDNG